MSEAASTVEGWYVLHEFFDVDWGQWRAVGNRDREAIVTEAAALLRAQEEPPEGHSGFYSVLTQKADLCLLHYRPNIEALRREELALRRTSLFPFLRPAYSYLSVIELGTYELRPAAAAALAKRGVGPDTEAYEDALREEMTRSARGRLFPRLPRRRYLCFYPMSKRRGEQVNWYDLPAEKRAEFMRGHGAIGRKYAGRVVQVISGSVGLDDWEWGVTLFADEPLLFKKLVYEMRFDPASSLFALFGPFYVGIRFAATDLGGVLSGEVPARTPRS